MRMDPNQTEELLFKYKVNEKLNYKKNHHHDHAIVLI